MMSGKYFDYNDQHCYAEDLQFYLPSEHRDHLVDGVLGHCNEPTGPSQLSPFSPWLTALLVSYLSTSPLSLSLWLSL